MLENLGDGGVVRVPVDERGVLTPDMKLEYIVDGVDAIGEDEGGGEVRGAET